MQTLVLCLRREQSADENGFQAYLEERRERLGSRLRDIGAKVYIHSPAASPELNVALRESRGLAETIDLFEEVIFDPRFLPAKVVIDAVASEASSPHFEMARSSAFFGERNLIYDLGGWESRAGAANRLIFAVTGRSDLTLDEVQLYWRQHHGPLATKPTQVGFGTRRYIQVHRLPSDIDQELTQFGNGQVYDGLATVWWPTFDAIQQAFTSRAGADANVTLIEDEPNFLDLSRTAGSVVKENVLFGDDEVREKQ